MSENKKIWKMGKSIRIGLTNSRLWLQNAFDKIAMPEYTIFSVLAILTGAAVGLAAVLFHHLINFFDNLFFELLLNKIVFISASVIILIPLIGMLIQYLMIHFFPKTAKR
mgnify:CR=1 FL=1